MLKPYNLLTQGFENNRTSHEKLFNQMSNFGAREEWREGRRVFGSHPDIETTKDQYPLLNPTPLEWITGYIMECDVGDRALKRLSHRRLNFIDGYISSYFYILNLPERLEHIRQENKLASVLCDLDSDRMK